jgi:hypothetical protein
MIAYDEPKVQIDPTNRLHVLHCSGPRRWSYSVIGVNGELVSHSSFAETKSRPHLTRMADGAITVRGGMLEQPVPPAGPGATANSAPKLSDRPESE